MIQHQNQFHRGHVEASPTSVGTMKSGGTSVAEQNGIKKKINFMIEAYIPQLDKMLCRLYSKIQQDDIDLLHKYKSELEKRRLFLQNSRGGCQQSMDYLISWEKQLVGLMNFPNHMAALRLPGEQLSQLQNPQLKQHNSNGNTTPIDQKMSVETMGSSGTSIGHQRDIKKKHIDFMIKVYIPQFLEMLDRLGSKIQQVKPDEIDFLYKYKTELEKKRSYLQNSQDRCRQSLDYLIRWEKRIVGLLNFPNLMAALRLSGDQLSQLQIPQLKQHNSDGNTTLIDQKSMPTPLPKARTPLQSANSPLYTISSCAPLVSSDLPGKPEHQQNIILSSLPKDGNIGQTLVSAVLQQGQAINNSTPVISDSSSVKKCAYLEFNQGGGTVAMIKPDKSVSTITPIERLLKAVNTSSSKALIAAVNDMYSVVSMTDVFAGSHPREGGARSSFPEDLVSTTRCRVERRKFDVIDDIVEKKKLKRCFSIASSLNALPLDYNENNGCKKVNGFESSEKLKSAATSGIKKSTLEMNRALSEEIREINQVLINTKLGISDEGTSLVPAAGENVEGVIVNCTYSPISRNSTKKFPTLPMWFLIPANYPLCSPVLCSSHVTHWDSDSCMYVMLLTEAASQFNESIRRMSAPISLKEMATCWDSRANAVFSW